MPPIDDNLATGSIRRHIKNMALPASIGFFCHTIYHVTDTFYAGFIGTDAVAALAFAFPIFFILLSCCVGFGQSMTSNVARALGARRSSKAFFLLKQGNYFAAGIYCALLLLVLPNIPELVSLMGAQGDARADAITYSRWVITCAPFFLYASLSNSALQSAGDTQAMRNAHLAAAALNVVLDPILMFGFLGIPALGMQGLVLATVISQSITCAYLLSRALRIRYIRAETKKLVPPSTPHLSALVYDSMAPSTRMLCISAFFFIATYFLGNLDGKAVAAYGIALRIEQLFLLPTIGLEIALLAIASQNFGAGKISKAVLAYRITLKYGMTFMALGGIALIIGGRFAVGLFSDDETVVRYGGQYLIVAATIGMMYVVVNAATAILLGAGKIKTIMLASVVRLIILPILLIFLLVYALDLHIMGIWIGIWISNAWAAWYLDKKCRKLLDFRHFRPVGQKPQPLVPPG